MAKEETKTPVVGGEKLTYEQLSAFTDRLQQEYKKLVDHTRELEKQVEAMRVNDYYNRAGLLFEIIKFDAGNPVNFSETFIKKVIAEFEELVEPSENKEDKKEE